MASLDTTASTATPDTAAASAASLRNAKKRAAKKRKQEVIKKLQSFVVDGKKEQGGSSGNPPPGSGEAAAAGTRSKTEKRRLQRRNIRELKAVFNSASGGAGPVVIEESVLLKAIDHEIEEADREAAANDPANDSFPNFAGRAGASDGEDDDDHDHDDDGPTSEENMLDLLRGTLAVMGSDNEGGSDSDGGDDGEASSSPMPAELVRAFRRASMSPAVLSP